MKVKSVREVIQKRFDTEYNTIPNGLERGKDRVLATVRGLLMCVTGNSGVGKSSYIVQHHILHPLSILHELESKDEERFDLYIELFLLKKSAQQFKAELLSRFLFEDHNIEIEYSELMSLSSKKDRKLTQAVIDILPTYDEWFAWFDTKVRIHTRYRSPTQIFNIVDAKLFTLGSIEHTKTLENGIEVSNEEWVYTNPNTFVTVIVDDLGSISGERNNYNAEYISTGAPAIKKLVNEYMVTLTKDFNCCCIVVHNQAIDKEKIQYDFTANAIEDKLEPSVDGLGDNAKEVGQTYDVVLGLFDPTKYKVAHHPKKIDASYSMAALKGNYRYLKILKTPYSKLGGLAMFFDARFKIFKELPKPLYFANPDTYEQYLNRNLKKH